MNVRHHRRLATGLLLLTLVLLCRGPACAEWVLVTTKVEDGRTAYTVYVDHDSLHHIGDLVTFWVLTDYTTIQTEPSPPYWSVKSQREIDCTEEQMRMLAVTAFSGKMGGGEVVYSYADSVRDGGVSIEPGSIAYSLLKFVCGNQQ